MRVFRFLLIICLAAAWAAPARGANDFSNDGSVKAVWNFDNVNLTADGSGNGNVLTNNGVTADTSNYIQGDASGDFDSSSSGCLSITDASLNTDFPTRSNDVSPSFTIMLRFRLNAETGYLIGKYDAGSNRSWAIKTSSRYVYFVQGHTSGTAEQASYSAYIRPTTYKWYSLICSYDDSTKTVRMLVWDNANKSTAAPSVRKQVLTNNISITTAPLTIGSYDGGGCHDCQIDEVIIIDEALTSPPEMLAYAKSLWEYGSSRPAKTWYVRPAGSKYGTGAGDSYTNAWDDLRYMAGIKGGIMPGDTVYICGTHLYTNSGHNNIVAKGDWYVSNGTAIGGTVTYRGDYPGDPGIIFEGAIINYDGWVRQTPPNDNVWGMVLKAAHDNAAWWEDVSSSSDLSFYTGSSDDNVLTKRSSIEECQANPGSHYSTDYDYGSYIYVSCRDGAGPSGRIYTWQYGYTGILLGGYAVFKNITFFSPGLFDIYDNEARTYTDVLLDGCTLQAANGRLVSMGTGDHRWAVKNCSLSYAGNAIYTISGDSTNAPNNFEFSNNTIEHIGVEFAANGDAHAIGVQGGRDGRIFGNSINNCGTGPVFHAYTNQECKNHWVFNNIIRNCHTLNSANSWGVGSTCDNDSLSDKSGNRFYNNIIINCAIGLRGQFEDLMEMSNNVIINCAQGFYANRTVSGMGPVVKLRNNIFYHSGTPTSFLHYGTGGTVGFDADFNLFNKTGPGWFDGASAPPGEHDVIGDPLFTNVTGDAPDDFKLRNGSPAIGKGEAADWLTVDYFDNKYLSPPSMGIHEAGSAPAGPLGIPAAFGPFPNMVGRGGARR